MTRDENGNPVTDFVVDDHNDDKVRRGIMAGELSALGNKTIRKDAIEKVKGEAKYIPDIQLPGMLYVRFLRSPYAHAHIETIDTSKAEELPGVKCVLTYKNVPKIHPMRKLEFLLDETVHYAGEEVAAVAALSPQIAEEALKLIQVEYEVLPAVFNSEDALQSGAALARQEYGTNIYKGTNLVKIPRLDKDGWLRLEVGDVEKGFSEADYILEGVFETPVQYNCSPLPRSVICEWHGDKLTCLADSQVPYFTWQDLARSFGIPQSKVRVLSTYAVGGYGGKTPAKTANLAAILAKRTGRPVKAVFSRTEDFIGTHHRVGFKNIYKIGVKRNGTITALHGKIIADWGSDTHIPYISQATAVLTCNMFYNCQNTRAESCGVLTNVLGYGSMNGFGDPEAIYGLERLMDEAAEKTGMDPVEFRLKNCVRYGSRAMDYEKVTNGPIHWGVLGQDMDSFPELIRKCADKAQWKEKWQGWQKPVAVNGPRKKGIGIAMGIHHTAYWPSSAIVKMNQDGSANVLSGAVEIGQGYASAICQVVAEAIGISYEAVTPVLADTAVTPASIGNIASTGTSSAINAAKLAADDVKHQLFELAAQRLKVSPLELESKDGLIRLKGTDQSIPIANLCFTNWQITGIANNPPLESIVDEKTGKVIHPFSAAVAIAEVEVDVENGQVELMRIIAGHDSGRSINPVVVENQIDLGLVMSNGWVRTEEYIVDLQTGIIINPNLLDYKLITFLDTPKSCDLEKIIVEKPCAWGPFGAKGMSETAMTALAPAIANAIYNAIGIRIYNGLLSPGNILSAIEKANRG